MDIYLLNNVIDGVNLVNRSFLVKMVKIGSFWGQKRRHKSKFWASGKKFSLEVSNNYFSQVYGNIFGRKCH